MIQLTRFNGTVYYLNAELIMSVEGTPDTVISLTNNTKLVVKEKAEQVIERIILYQRLVHNPELQLKVGA